MGRIDNMTLNVTTPYQQIKAGAYTGNITEPRRRTINLSQTKSHPLRMTFAYFSVTVLSVLTVSAGGVCAASKSRISFK